jgi:hypothetical protein
MNPYECLSKCWLEKLSQALEFKKKEFQDDADECYRFFDGTYEFMYQLRAQRSGFQWTGNATDFPKPSFCMTLNKVAEAVQIFGPVLYHRNPVRTVTPQVVPDLPPEFYQMMAGGPSADPMMMQQAQMQMQMAGMAVQQSNTVAQARSSLLSHYLNFTPEALDLKREYRWAVDECIIKGMGCMWPEVYRSPGQTVKMFGSFFDSVDNLLIDPDVRQLKDAKWIARKRVRPVWEVEQTFGYAPGTLKRKGTFESGWNQAAVEADTNGLNKRQEGYTNDLMVYWEIWSKMGLGGRLQGADPDYRQYLDPVGNFCYLAVCSSCAYPLNLREEWVQTGGQEMVAQAVQWGTPFWFDGGWPFSPTIFHERPNKLWPMSHMKPALGELKFLNWAYSFVASKIRITSRDFIAMKKSVGEELKTAILHGGDLELLEIEADHGTISEAVQFLQHPTFNADIWQVLDRIEQNFEKRVGLSELMYGESSRQMRSAQEANVKAGQLQIRPDDMAMRVEEAATQMARMEAFGARWHLTGRDVATVMGPVGEQAWDQLITSSKVEDIAFGLQYRIEAGSARKPNKDTKAANMTLAMQNLFTPLFQACMTTGDFTPLNSLTMEWAESQDFDASGFLFPNLPPPMPPPAGEEGGSGPPADGGQAA